MLWTMTGQSRVERGESAQKTKALELGGTLMGSMAQFVRAEGKELSLQGRSHDKQEGWDGPTVILHV